MEISIYNRRLTALIVSLLLLTSFFSMGMSSATTSHPKPSDMFSITVSRPKSPVCVGESRLITVSWSQANKNDILAPLSGPRVIYAKTLYGSFDRSTYHPGTISGTTTFTYTAEKEGNDIITIQAMNSSLDPDGVGFAELEVKECDYRFDLYAQLNADVGSDDFQMGLQYVLRAKGRLTKDGASLTGQYEAYYVTVHLETIITSFNTPDCTLVTWKPGKGTGLVDVRAIPDKGSSRGMTVQFSPLKDMNWQVDMTATCDGQPISYSVSIPMSSSRDPWIEGNFPTGTGSRKVEVDLFEEGVKNFTGANVPADYTATLTLERVEKQ